MRSASAVGGATKKMEGVSKALIDTIDVFVLYVYDTCIESGSICAPRISLELRQWKKGAEDTCFRIIICCRCCGVNSEEVRPFLLQQQSVGVLSGTHPNIQLQVTQDGNATIDSILYDKTTTEICGFLLNDEEFELVSAALRKHVELLYMSHPLIKYVFISQPCSGESGEWMFPSTEGEYIYNSVANMGRRYKIASDSIYYRHSKSSVANDGWALQPIVGQAYKVTSAVGDSPHLLMLSAGVSFIPPIKYSRLRKQNKKIPADSFLSAVKILVFGPGGLPLWMDNTDPVHLSTSLVDWGNYGISLRPEGGRSGEGDFTGRNYTVVAEGDSKTPAWGEQRILILIIFMWSSSTSISGMDRLHHLLESRSRLQSTSRDALAQCSKQCRLASQSVLNRVFFNYGKEKQLTATVSSALPSLSEAVASIISSSENESFRSRCLSILNSMEDTSTGEVTTCSGEDRTCTSMTEEETKASILHRLNELAMKPSSLQRDFPLIPKAVKMTTQSSTPVESDRESLKGSTPESDHAEPLEGDKVPSLPESCPNSPDIPLQVSKTYLCKYFERKRRANHSQDKESYKADTNSRLPCTQQKQYPKMDVELNNTKVLAAHVISSRISSQCGSGTHGTPEPQPLHLSSDSEERFLTDWDEDSDVHSSSDHEVTLSPGNLTFSSEFGSEVEFELGHTLTPSSFKDDEAFLPRCSDDPTSSPPILQGGLHLPRCEDHTSSPSVSQSRPHLPRHPVDYTFRPSLCDNHTSSPSILQDGPHLQRCSDDHASSPSVLPSVPHLQRCSDNCTYSPSVLQSVPHLPKCSDDHTSSPSILKGGHPILTTACSDDFTSSVPILQVHTVLPWSKANKQMVGKTISSAICTSALSQVTHLEQDSLLHKAQVLPDEDTLSDFETLGDITFFNDEHKVSMTFNKYIQNSTVDVGGSSDSETQFDVCDLQW